MINPELAAGMVFLPGMAANESIEIVGAERYSNYKGYASTFRFAGDFVDTRARDCYGRRQTHIIAIDALSQPGDDQFRLTHIMRELSKAYCGFLDTGIGGGPSMSEAPPDERMSSQTSDISMDSESPQVFDDMMLDSPLVPGTSETIVVPNGLGVATGNWGCGVFGGNLALKSLLQWMAASQAGCPFVLYFSFQNPDALRLQVLASSQNSSSKFLIPKLKAGSPNTVTSKLLDINFINKVLQ